MFYTIYQYFQFLSKSNNEHGVHSPFVFKFLTTGIYNFEIRNKKSQFKDYYKTLSQSKQHLKASSLGASSKKIKSSGISVSKLAKIAGSRGTKASLLIKIASYFKPGQILELGTSLGLGTVALQIGNPNAKITSVEGAKEIFHFTKSHLALNGYESIDCIHAEFDKALKKLDTGSYDLIFIDGNHKYQATMKYFHWAINHLNQNGIIIFDDIYWSKEMTKAWKEISGNQNINLSIDFFYLGIIMIRPEQRKQHFILRS